MIVLFDLDSTLCNLEWCDRLADKKGIGDQVKTITEATMNGEMNFETAFPAKTNMIAPSRDEIISLANEYLHHVTPGINNLIRQLQASEHKVGILTQGYTLAAKIVGQYLNIEADLIAWVDFDFDDEGNYIGIAARQHIAHADGKARLVRAIQANYPHEQIVMIGDSVSDMKTQGIADLFIGFGAHVVRTKVQEQAQVFIYSVDWLRDLLFMTDRSNTLTTEVVTDTTSQTQNKASKHIYISSL